MIAWLRRLLAPRPRLTLGLQSGRATEPDAPAPPKCRHGLDRKFCSACCAAATLSEAARGCDPLPSVPDYSGHEHHDFRAVQAAASAALVDDEAQSLRAHHRAIEQWQQTSRADAERRKLGIEPPVRAPDPTIDEVVAEAQRQVAALEARLAAMQSDADDAHRALTAARAPTSGGLAERVRLLDKRLEFSEATANRIANQLNEAARTIHEVNCQLDCAGAPGRLGTKSQDLAPGERVAWLGRQLKSARRRLTVAKKILSGVNESSRSEKPSK